MSAPRGLSIPGLVLVEGAAGRSPAYTAAAGQPIGPAAFEALKNALTGRPGGSVRINLHPGPEAPVHDMIVALAAGGVPYVHRHRTREETYHLIAGLLRLSFYDDAGRATRVLELGDAASGLPQLVRIPADVWHSTEALTPAALFHESRPGPLDPTDTEQRG